MMYTESLNCEKRRWRLQFEKLEPSPYTASIADVNLCLVGKAFADSGYIPQRTLPKPKTKNWPLPLNRDEPVNLLFYEVLNSERQFLDPVFVKNIRPRKP